MSQAYICWCSRVLRNQVIVGCDNSFAKKGTILSYSDLGFNNRPRIKWGSCFRCTYMIIWLFSIIIRQYYRKVTNHNLIWTANADVTQRKVCQILYTKNFCSKVKKSSAISDGWDINPQNLGRLRSLSTILCVGSSYISSSFCKRKLSR